LTPRQYQALLAIKGSGQQERLTIGELAEQLQIVHHAAVELVDRLSAQNLVERHDGVEDRRKVFVQLSRTGSTILETLSGTPRRTSSIESRPSSSAGESYFGWRNNAESAETSIWLKSGTWHFMDDEKSEVELDIEILVALAVCRNEFFVLSHLPFDLLRNWISVSKES
jgi:DNA-binding MarR family transcriptional regulator